MAEGEGVLVVVDCAEEPVGAVEPNDGGGPGGGGGVVPDEGDVFEAVLALGRAAITSGGATDRRASIEA